MSRRTRHGRPASSKPPLEHVQDTPFHNENPFDADDVVFSLERIGDELSILRDRRGPVTAVETVDDQTVGVVTVQRNPILLNLRASLMMMDAERAEANGALTPTGASTDAESFTGRNENGPGPFRTVAREAEVQTMFGPFAEWWGTPGHNLARVEFKPIAQDGTRVAALLSDEIDMMFPVARAATPWRPRRFSRRRAASRALRPSRG